jgi:hypothetical protein
MRSARITAAGITVLLTAGLVAGCTSAPTEGASTPAATPVASSTPDATSTPDTTPAPGETTTTAPEDTAPAAPQDFEVGQEVSIDDRKAVEEAGLAVYKDRKGNVTVWDPSTNKMPKQAVKDIQSVGQTKAPEQHQTIKDAVSEMRRASAWTNGLIPVSIIQATSHEEDGTLISVDGWTYMTTGDILEYGDIWPTRAAALAGVKAKIAASPNAEKYTIIDLG